MIYEVVPEVPNGGYLLALGMTNRVLDCGLCGMDVILYGGHWGVFSSSSNALACSVV